MRLSFIPNSSEFGIFDGIGPVSGEQAALMLRDFLNRHLPRGLGNGGGGNNRTSWTAAAFATKAGISASRISEWRNLKGGLPQLSSLQALEWAFFPDIDARSKEPAFIEWQQVRRAIERQGEPAQAAPDQPTLSLREAWALLTRPIVRNTIPIVRSAPNEPGAGQLREEQISAWLLDRRFILPMPESFLAALREDPFLADRYDVHPAVDLDGQADIAALCDTVPVPGFRAIVAYHAEAYGQFVLSQLRQRQAYPPYNKPKVGLHGYQQSQRSGRSEGVYLDLDFYQTDYHTHRVMRRVLHDLRVNHPALFTEQGDLYEGRPWLRYFTTSFGINILATTDEAQGRRCYMVQLSHRQGNPNQQGLWHVSANEGVTVDDAEDRRILLSRVVARALMEELGHAYDPSRDETRYLEFAFDLRNLEPFISCVTHLGTDRDSFYRQKQRLARDDRREFAQVRDIAFTEQEIIRMVLDHPDGAAGFTSYCLNILDSVLVRGMAE
jgi:hypothetical protein